MIRWQEMRMDMIVDNIHHFGMCSYVCLFACVSVKVGVATENTKTIITNIYFTIIFHCISLACCETFVKLSCASEVWESIVKKEKKCIK